MAVIDYERRQSESRPIHTLVAAIDVVSCRAVCASVRRTCPHRPGHRQRGLCRWSLYLSQWVCVGSGAGIADMRQFVVIEMSVFR
jgi:hypothetical protein